LDNTLKNVYRQEKIKWRRKNPQRNTKLKTHEKNLGARRGRRRAIRCNLFLLRVWHDSREIEIPQPSEVSGDDIYYIEPDLKIAFAIALKQEREKLGLTQKEAAARMNVKWAFYQRIENPRNSNPTLATIEKLQKAFSRRFLVL
jgi:antitoxin HicB